MPDPTESKEDLECLKLRLEIGDLRRSPWAKPSIVFPILAALLTLGVSEYLGVFDVERKRVELQAQEAELKRTKLQDDLVILEANKKELQKEKDDLAQRKRGLGLEVAKLENTVKSLRAEAGAARQELNQVKNVLARPNLVIQLRGGSSHEKSLCRRFPRRGPRIKGF
jgi:outer membrane murein-binding lipoprotein Lpp